MKKNSTKIVLIQLTSSHFTGSIEVEWVDGLRFSNIENSFIVYSATPCLHLAPILDSDEHHELDPRDLTARLFSNLCDNNIVILVTQLATQKNSTN